MDFKSLEICDHFIYDDGWHTFLCVKCNKKYYNSVCIYTGQSFIIDDNEKVIKVKIKVSINEHS